MARENTSWTLREREGGGGEKREGGGRFNKSGAMEGAVHNHQSKT